MTKYILSYLITFLTFIFIDGVWLGFVARNFYAKHLGYLMTDNINWYAAIIFYMIFVLGLLVFVVYPAFSHQNIYKILLYGAFFGLVTYATYDLTNLATIKNWPLVVTIIDMIWGSLLSLLVSVISYLLIRYFNLV